ncbi:hypothetical protein Y695_04036 [Hydrogenophaga sp. T4]|nr:hypothetical protein Y695_04036 [Hydrogenophaga sp. T4]
MVQAGHGIEHGGSDAGLPAYTHAVPDHDVLVLPDIRLDARFASDASVTGAWVWCFLRVRRSGTAVARSGSCASWTGNRARWTPKNGG